MATAAYDVVFAETGNTNKARAARWLAVLRRDYQNEYDQLMSGLGVDHTTEAR